MRKKGLIWEKRKFRKVEILGKIWNTWKAKKINKIMWKRAKEKKKKNTSKTENMIYMKHNEMEKKLGKLSGFWEIRK